VTVVQEPEGSYESQMAVSALKRGPAVYVLPLARIAELFSSLPGVRRAARGSAVQDR
jgi:chemotaxis response regulator CheB